MQAMSAQTGTRHKILTLGNCMDSVAMVNSSPSNTWQPKGMTQHRKELGNQRSLEINKELTINTSTTHFLS